MNVNVYLPDDLGKRAKRADLAFSQLLRDAVTAELERREAMASTLTDDPQTFELELEDKDGFTYKGRITGKLITSEERGGLDVYLTEDERVILYYGERLDYWELDDPEYELRDELEMGTYREACAALGIKPNIVVDI